jgi:hypothetical protein
VEEKETELLAKLKDQLLDRVPKGPEGDQVGCFLCKWILEDLAKNGKLTDGHPAKATDGSSQFPAEGKKKHLVVEGFWVKGLQFLMPEIDVKK